MTTEEVDYIIVGAGSAGCVLANRLSANPRNRVVLLEAGGSDRSPWIRMPIGYGKTFYHPDLNWRYVSEDVPGLSGRTSYWPRGRVLGGSSSINAMVFIRGQSEDFDDWARLGNPGWAFEDVLPAFKRVEDNANGADEWRAAGGPVGVSDASGKVHPLCSNFLDAAVEAGLPLNRDFNGATQEGVGIYQITTRNGFRSSAASAYLRPAMKRANLRVLTRAHVTRVMFEGRKAVGVEYIRRGRQERIRTAGEVIVAAGAVNTPQLLQLSGLGSPVLLAGLGIEPKHALPAVGENLQDHLCIDHVYRSRSPTLNDELGPWLGKLRVGLRYLLARSGPLSLSVNQAGGFWRSNPQRIRPNIQLYFSPMSYTRAIPGKRQLMRPDMFSGFLLGASNCHPTSRGHIRIQSPDPMAPPAIQPNYLSNSEDMEELVEGSLLLRKLAAQPSLAGLIEAELQPGMQVSSRNEIEADIRLRAGSVFHACGTCAMGSDPATAVVDARLRVHGTQGLRIADASIFPRLTSGNINAPVMMVGEMASAMIAEDSR